ncbi:hypothetical protein, partial [Mesorhizobium sp. M0085]|uniref:hypothetical protein n=1 Tax=Mesorhizobium sp. M0085 TaxID=2956872 RepID=UPI00333B5AB2
NFARKGDLKSAASLPCRPLARRPSPEGIGWSAEAIIKADQLRQELGYFITGQVIETPEHVDEYPGK